jgi:hypothetical protein
VSDRCITFQISGLCHPTSGDIPPCLTQNIHGIFDLLFSFICLNSTKESVFLFFKNNTQENLAAIAINKAKSGFRRFFLYRELYFFKLWVIKLLSSLKASFTPPTAWINPASTASCPIRIVPISWANSPVLNMNCSNFSLLICECE